MIDYTAARMGPGGVSLWRQYNSVCPAKCYIPTRPQFDLIKAVGTLPFVSDDHPEGVRVFLIRSGNGAGKSTGVHNIILNLAYPGLNIYDDVMDVQTGEKWPGFFNWPFYMHYPSRWPKKLWYVSNKDAIHELHEKFRSWAPLSDIYEDVITEEKSGKTYVANVRFKSCNWQMAYKTVDQDPKVFESADIGLVVFDEPPPRRLFKAAFSRLRSGGIIIIVATPLEEGAWFVDEILDRIREDNDKWDQKVSVWTNCIERAGEWDLGRYGIQKKGNLDEINLKAQIKNYDVDERPARVDGEFLFLSGLVFKSYNQGKVSPRKGFDIISKNPYNYLYRFVMDPHDRKPPAASWYKLDQWGRVEKIREWPSVADPQFNGNLFINIKDSGEYTIEDFVRFWLEIELELGIPHWRINDFIDPNFGMKRDSNTGKRIFQLYMDASRKVGRQLGTMRRYAFMTDINDSIADGHRVIKEMLKPFTSGDMPYRIHPSCVNTDLAYRRYSYKRQTSKKEEEDGQPEATAKGDNIENIEQKYKDFIDLDRYCFIVPWSYKAPPRYQNKYTGGDYQEDTVKLPGWQKRLKTKLATLQRPEGADSV